MIYVTARLLKQYGRSFKAGTVLCREEEPGDQMFIIYQGKVRISKKMDNEEKTLVVLGDGDFFGEMAIILKEPRTATATCVTDAVVLIIDSEGFETMVRKSPDMSLRLIKTLAERLKSTNNLVAILGQTDPESRVILYIEDLARKSDVKVEDGIQIMIDFKDITGRLFLTEKDMDSVLEKLKRASLCYKLRQNFYVVTDLPKLRRFLDFLKEQKNKSVQPSPT
jgi:CRP/FNR family transcriptional regulator, cyclic AMP receptor protein